MKRKALILIILAMIIVGGNYVKSLKKQEGRDGRSG